MASLALVLSAGGPTATAFHGGALAGLMDETGWDARDATLIVGTSAGSSCAAMLRGGFSPRDEFARLTDDELSAEGQRFADRVRASVPRDSEVRGNSNAFRPLGLRMAFNGLLPHRFRPGLVLSGLAPRGSQSLARMAATARAAHEQSWPEESTWVVAARVSDGARAVFGRDDLPPTDIGTAVQASSAVPNVYRPVRIGRHEFVDGAIHSSTNADLVAPLGFDAVVIISSMTAVPREARCTERDPTRTYFSRKLSREVAAIRAHGTPVLVVQPTADDLSLRDGDLDDAAINAIARQARETVRTKLARSEALHARKMLEATPV
ncbi:MAG: patatin-like phospholipase family protein [Acidimicrobiales bacterium]